MYSLNKGVVVKLKLFLKNVMWLHSMVIEKITYLKEKRLRRKETLKVAVVTFTTIQANSMKCDRTF